jgi:hypothetical protein
MDHDARPGAGSGAVRAGAGSDARVVRVVSPRRSGWTIVPATDRSPVPTIELELGSATARGSSEPGVAGAEGEHAVRKTISLSLGVALASMVLVAVPVSADSSVVQDLGPCALPGVDGNGFFTYGGVGTLTHAVQNDNTAVTTCQGSGMTNELGSTQYFSGFLCYAILPQGDGLVETFDSEATVTSTGEATMTCTVTLDDA